jgi:hypothetical protein
MVVYPLLRERDTLDLGLFDWEEHSDDTYFVCHGADEVGNVTPGAKPPQISHSRLATA